MLKSATAHMCAESNERMKIIADYQSDGMGSLLQVRRKGKSAGVDELRQLRLCLCKIGVKWQISPKREPIPDPEKASELEIVFEDYENSASLVKFEHRNFENHGDKAKDYLKMMDSEQAWDYILYRYKRYCENKMSFESRAI